MVSIHIAALAKSRWFVGGEGKHAATIGRVVFGPVSSTQDILHGHGFGHLICKVTEDTQYLLYMAMQCEGKGCARAE